MSDWSDSFMAMTINILKSFSGNQNKILELHVLKSSIWHLPSHSTKRTDSNRQTRVCLLELFNLESFGCSSFIPFTGLMGMSLIINSALILLFQSTNWLPHWDLWNEGEKCTSFPSMCTLGAMITFRCHLTKSWPQPHRLKQSSTGTFSWESASGRKLIFTWFSLVNVFGSIDLVNM